jgi:hypothetical protein
MGLQKYRADVSGEPDENGAVPFYSKWMGGPSLALIRNCPVDTVGIEPRTVYITSEPDTFFTQPAACKVKGKTVRGYVTHSDHKWLFHADKEGK